MPGVPKHDKGTLPHDRDKGTLPHDRPEGDDMAKKIAIRPLDKKETTGESGGNGGA
ncbi:hypothetical protein GA0115257_10703 [Streptomyces sp. LcepLS]|nr:hypothetical protein GA0115251_13844 [Streptomyces sp. TverLS-915]SCE56026.1 hypothetical protein GA0115252_16492 [Streptomyces sp. DfronAA-171]SCF11022.1 hypothetical protein GA0115257_10703 [Streptomyces sp. LcepLS]